MPRETLTVAGTQIKKQHSSARSPVGDPSLHICYHKDMKPIEQTIDKIHKSLPHLDTKLQKHLGKNLWIGAATLTVLEALALIYCLQALVNLGRFSGVLALTNIGPILTLHTVVATLGVIGVGVLAGMAITPLKERKISGWRLLLLALMVGVGTGVINLIFSIIFMLNFVWVFMSILLYLGGLYAVMEAREWFVNSPKPKTNSAKAEKK